MKPMAAPTVGGLVTATLANLILVPVLYSWIKEKQIKREASK
jgi:Cu/Ag efflux pump CusA